MARIAGVDLPGNKQVRIALTYIYGIGDPRALKILEKAGIDPYAKMATLDEDQLNKQRAALKEIFARRFRSTSSA
jgi:small subunit ribosomal protein S13